MAYLGPTGGPSGPLPIVVEASWLPEEEKARAGRGVQKTPLNWWDFVSTSTYYVEKGYN